MSVCYNNITLWMNLITSAQGHPWNNKIMKWITTLGWYPLLVYYSQQNMIASVGKLLACLWIIIYMIQWDQESSDTNVAYHVTEVSLSCSWDWSCYWCECLWMYLTHKANCSTPEIGGFVCQLSETFCSVYVFNNWIWNQRVTTSNDVI